MQRVCTLVKNRSISTCPVSSRWEQQSKSSNRKSHHPTLCNPPWHRNDTICCFRNETPRTTYAFPNASNLASASLLPISTAPWKEQRVNSNRQSKVMGKKTRKIPKQSRRSARISLDATELTESLLSRRTNYASREGGREKKTTNARRITNPRHSRPPRWHTPNQRCGEIYILVRSNKL